MLSSELVIIFLNVNVNVGPLVKYPLLAPSPETYFFIRTLRNEENYQFEVDQRLTFGQNVLIR